MIEYALNYLKNGIEIFPCHAKSKIPLIKDWRNCSSNYNSDIENWWIKKPDANIAIPTGKLNKIEVLDFDVKSGGLESLREIINKYGHMNSEYVVKTGSGGYHFYYSYSNRGYKNKIGFLSGVDFKTDGGYVIAPPSIHESGNHYKWINFDYEKFLKTGDGEC